MRNMYQQQNSMDLIDGQGTHRWDVTNQTIDQKKEWKKNKRGKEREGTFPEIEDRERMCGVGQECWAPHGKSQKK